MVAALAACFPEPHPVDLEGQAVRMTVLHTSDIHSRLLPYKYTPLYTDEQLGLDPAYWIPEGFAPQTVGGAARMATVVARERARARRVLHLDSGDVFQGAPIFNQFAGEVEMRVLSQLGVDAAVVGNHEFDRGAENYSEQLAMHSSIHSLAANYRFEDPDRPWNNALRTLTKPYVIFYLDGLRVGVIGMGNLSSISSIGEGDNSLDVEPQGNLWSARHYSDLIAPYTDLIIVVSHLGLSDDEEIARRVPNVDVIIGGHLHLVMDPPKVVESEVATTADGRPKQVVVCHSGAFTKFLGRLDLVVRDGEVLSHDYEVIPLDNRVPENGDMQDLLEPYERELKQQLDLDRVVARSSDVIRRFGVSGGDSPLGNLVAEAMQLRPGIETDFGMTNSLGIRADIQRGDITVEEIFNVLPFDNTIVTMFLTGTEVQEVFDYVTRRSAGRGCNAQVQISSARFVMDCTTERARDVTVGGTWESCVTDDDCSKDEEICSSRACGVPIVPTAVYELATNNYIARGGSGFQVLERNTTQTDHGVSMRDAVLERMEQCMSDYCADDNGQWIEGCNLDLTPCVASDDRILPRF
jgi:5'-nucleotidase